MTETMLATFFQRSGTPLAVLDPAGTFVHLNDAWESVVKNASGLRKTHFRDIFKASDATRVSTIVGRLRAERPESFDARISATATGGAERLMRFHLSQDENSGYIRVTAIASALPDDVHRLAILDDIVGTGAVVLFTLDKDGHYTSWDGANEHPFGGQPESLVGKSALEQWNGTEGETILRRALEGHSLITPLSLPGPVHLQLHLLPIRDAAGAPDGVIGFVADLTRDRVAQDQLREKMAVIERQNAAMQMFQRVMQSASVILWAIDRDGICTLSEGKGLELIGAQPGQMVGMNLLEVYKDNEDISTTLVRALGGEDMRVLSNPFPDVHFEGWNMPLRDGETGEIHGVIGFAMDASHRVKVEMELREKLSLIERQSATIRALATPIIQVWDDVLCMPVIGTVDSARTADMMQSLLQAIVRDQARFAIVDLTGVEVVDTSTADHLIQLLRAAKVLGVDGVLCGIRPAVAQTVVALGLELTSVRTMRSLRDALKWCIRARAQDGARVRAPDLELPSARRNAARSEG